MNAARTITIKMWVYPSVQSSHESGNSNVIDGIVYSLYGFKSPEAIAQCDVTFTLPEGFDPVSKAVKELEEQREQLRAEFQMALNEVNDRIGKLQAITCEVPA